MKRKSMNRLGTTMLKLMVLKMMESRNELKRAGTSKSNLKLYAKDMENLIELVAKIMAKAESSKDIKFSKKEEENSSVTSICNKFNIDISKFKKDEDEEICSDCIKEKIKKAVESVVSKDENVKIVKLEEKEVLDLLNSLTKKMSEKKK